MLQNLNEELGLPASFPGGEGEQHWGGKRKRRYMKENVSYTPEKRIELLDKYNKILPEYKSKVERYKNVFNGFNLEELTTSLEPAKKFVKLGESLETELDKISTVLEDISDQYGEEDDLQNAKKAGVVEAEYYKYKQVVYNLYSAMEDIISIIEKIQQ